MEWQCVLQVADILNIKLIFTKINMGLFSFLKKEIAIDLGTANTIIIYNDKVVVDEPSIVAIDRKTEKIIAVGKKALMMHGKTHENIITIRPLRDGVIADFQAAEFMIREMIKMINPKKSLFPPALKMVVCIPSGITEVEERAVRDSAEQAGAKEVRLIHEPMAAAIGIGIDVLEPTGNMIVDIGGGTSEIAVIALGGIVNNKSIRIAGDDFNADIVEYMRKQHNINIGERTAERIKIEVGAAITELENPPEDYAVHGRDMLTGIPKEIMVNYVEIANALDKSISKIEAAVLNALENTPPELSADIFRTGIYLAGGGSLLRGLDKRIHLKTKLPVHVADDPLRAVARGTGIALKNFEKFTFLIK
jgi:rod shape-determining protein MreB